MSACSSGWPDWGWRSRKSFLLEREREARFLAVGRGAGDNAGFDGLVISRMDAGQELGGFIFFAGGDGGAEIFFQAAQLGFDAAVLEVLAGSVEHPAFG